MREPIIADFCIVLLSRNSKFASVNENEHSRSLKVIKRKRGREKRRKEKEDRVKEKRREEAKV